jgi:three-Cys-motif partner protein
LSVSDHEFGGQHTDIKLAIVEQYLQRYSAALHTWCDKVWYIDAFAGTGHRTERVAAQAGDLVSEPVPEQVVQRRGSAKIALDIEPAFDRLVFMDVKPRHVAALMELREQYPGREIDILQGNANELIQKDIRWHGWRSTRAVMFLDPYGMEVEWETLQMIAGTKAIDVWYLFPLAGLYRQAARNFSKIDDSKERAITRMLGTEEWKEKLYAEVQPAPDLLGLLDMPAVRQRAANVAALEQYVAKRLRTIFPEVLEPYALPPVERPQRYSLFCAISNPSPKATSLARSFGNSITKSLTASHRMSGR